MITGAKEGIGKKLQIGYFFFDDPKTQVIIFTVSTLFRSNTMVIGVTTRM